MKKSITGAVALLAGAFVAHSQGTVSFGNYAFLSTYVYVSLKSGSKTTPLNGSATGTGVAANDAGAGSYWTVALYGAAGSGDPASSLLQLDTSGGTAVTANFTGVPSGSAGEWASTEIGVVPGTTGSGSPATVQLYAWYNDGGKYTTYASALAAGVPTGFSTTGNVTLGGPGSPPATPASLPTGTGANQIGSFSVSGTSTVPEPSTIALGVMGASAFLLRLRKKQ